MLTTSINDTSSKFCHQHRWQIATGIGGKLPPVSTTPAGKFATGVNNISGKQWY
jgi:hypothetical protein